jgi:hypothetical protein
MKSAAMDGRSGLHRPQARPANASFGQAAIKDDRKNEPKKSGRRFRRPL